jgi:peptide deformylase
MEILKFSDENNEILRKKTKKVQKKDIDEKFLENVEIMKGLIRENNTIGLSAPQIGWGVSLFILFDISKQPEEQFKICINPEILESSEHYILSEEGCISSPDIFVKIPRRIALEVAYKNLKFRKVKEQLFDDESCIFQHELDHLNGILINDYLEEEKE